MSTYKISGITLHLSIKCFPYDTDYVCTDDNYDGAPDAGRQLMGEGATEIEAIHDYLEQYLGYI